MSLTFTAPFVTFQFSGYISESLTFFWLVEVKINSDIIKIYFPGCWLIQSEAKYVFIFQKLLCLEQFIQIHLNVKYMKSLISEQSEHSTDFLKMHS